MEQFISIIENKIMDVFSNLGYDREYGKITISDRPDLCEYQCNGALSLAKVCHKNPILIAEEIAQNIELGDMFEKVEVVRPGFINLIISKTFLASYLNDMHKFSNLGCQDIGKGKRVIVDYGGPNVAKPLHIGHLRPAVIGESIKRIKRFCGYDVVGDVHLGDWGLQMGLVIAGLIEKFPYLSEYSKDEIIEKEVEFTVNDLEVIYPLASKRSKEDEAFSSLAHEITYHLQNGHKGYRALWRKIVDISISDLKKNYLKLDVSFDVWNGESDAQVYIPEMIEKMKSMGLLQESQGALVVDVREEDDAKEIPPCIIVKSDGASLYSTTDLATLIQREREYSPEEVIYVVDKRQDLHFIQVFRTARKAKLVSDNTKLLFIGFGTVNGQDGKPFKTRDGGVMRLENLLSEVESLVLNKVNTKRLEEDKISENTKLIALSAIKYGDLSNQISKDYVFDMSKFCDFAGNDMEEKQNNINGAFSDIEKKLQLELVRFNEVIASSCLDNAPNKICQYIYSIADKFNAFYNDINVSSESDSSRKNSYISLLILTKEVLKISIDLLGFKEVEAM